MPWLRLDAGYFSHPKIVRAGLYGWQVHLAALTLCKCYGWAGTLRKADFSPALIARHLNAGNAKSVTSKFAEGIASCVEIGLLTEDATHYHIHDWDAFQRDQTVRQRVAKHRASKKTADDVTAGNAKRVGNGIQYGTGQDVQDKTNPPPSAAPPTATAGGSASPLSANGHGNGALNEVLRPPSPSQVAGARAMAAVILGTKDAVQEHREDAKACIRALDSGNVTAEQVEAFARRHYGRTERRVAYLTPP